MLNIPPVIAIVVLLIIAIPIAVALALAGSRSRNSIAPPPAENYVFVPPSDEEITRLVNGRYDVKRQPFKQGGMANVWLANDRASGRTCIIKTPRRGTRMDNVYLDKLMLEADYLKRLRHPLIVRYLDDFYSDGEFHLVLEYVSGETMMASNNRTSLNEQTVIAIASQLLEALSYVHGMGVIHRDINPKNIMLCNDGSVKLIDFGTAKNLGEIRREVPGSDPFTQIANKGFDIPELFINGGGDQRGDICGVAQTCIYLLTLRHPNELCHRIINSSWPRSPHEAVAVANHLVASGISKRTARCLAQGILYSPDHRFCSARTMQAALF